LETQLAHGRLRVGDAQERIDAVMDLDAADGALLGVRDDVLAGFGGGIRFADAA